MAMHRHASTLVALLFLRGIEVDLCFYPFWRVVEASVLWWKTFSQEHTAKLTKPCTFAKLSYSSSVTELPQIKCNQWCLKFALHFHDNKIFRMKQMALCISRRRRMGTRSESPTCKVVGFKTQSLNGRYYPQRDRNHFT